MDASSSSPPSATAGGSADTLHKYRRITEFLDLIAEGEGHYFQHRQDDPNQHPRAETETAGVVPVRGRGGGGSYSHGSATSTPQSNGIRQSGDGYVPYASHVGQVGKEDDDDIGGLSFADGGRKWGNKTHSPLPSSAMNPIALMRAFARERDEWMKNSAGSYSACSASGSRASPKRQQEEGLQQRQQRQRVAVPVYAHPTKGGPKKKVDNSDRHHSDRLGDDASPLSQTKQLSSARKQQQRKRSQQQQLQQLRATMRDSAFFVSPDPLRDQKLQKQKRQLLVTVGGVANNRQLQEEARQAAAASSAASTPTASSIGLMSDPPSPIAAASSAGDYDDEEEHWKGGGGRVGRPFVGRQVHPSSSVGGDGGFSVLDSTSW